MRRKKSAVMILHHAPPQTAGEPVAWRESDAGVLVEAAGVARALDALGISHRTVAVSSLAGVSGVLASAPEPVVFNLVEDFPGASADAALVPALCRAMGKAFTGSDTPCLVLTLDKWQSKAVLVAAGVPCPRSVLVPVNRKPPARGLGQGPFIVKPVRADASEGIDSQSVVSRSGRLLGEAVERVHREFRQAALVEQFIDGRELIIALLDGPRGTQVLPASEIDFSSFPKGRHRIVDYAAKWLPESFEYRNTPRIIPAPLGKRLEERICRMAREAWAAVGGEGYGRVDFRVDRRGRPWVIEVNANPDISPDDGFVAALAVEGIRFKTFVKSMIDRALSRAGGLAKRQSSGISARRVSERARTGIEIRRTQAADRDTVLALVAETGFFRPDELEIAREVLDDGIAHGPQGHYQSYVAVVGARVVGWVAFGPTPCTVGAFDIYWLAVAPSQQGRGVGSALMAHAEGLIAHKGGRLGVVETSGRPIYDPTRRFYERLGYREAARVPDFYAPGDAKIIYTKPLG